MKMPILRCLLIVFSLAITSPVLAWSEFGHMLIAELAHKQLDPKLQRKLESQSFSLIKKQDAEKRLYLMRAYPDSSAFAQMSVFADDYRNQTLEELYSRFGKEVPAVFKNIANEDTSKWHYKNQAYASEIAHKPWSSSEGKVCDLSEPVDVAWAVEQLQIAFKQAETEEDQVLALALLVHFVADAHQPLHGLSRVDEDCDSDRGGNRFCVVYRKNSYSCEMNLHAFWDSGVGFFESFDRVSDAVEFVARVELDENQVSILDPDEWLAEGYRKARFIYSIKDGSGGDSYYIKEGQIISYERMALAANRLAQILNQLY